jgi:hypothetical protein
MALPTQAMVRSALLAIAALCLAVLATAPGARAAAALMPPGKKVYFGISDTGDPADFGEFSRVMNKHPALIQTFRTWGSDFPESIERWQEARARPVIHITTADNNDGHELITPRAIAAGEGDGYLIRLNKLFASKDMPAYVRPLGEPNRCLNVYAAYDCAGGSRGSAHSPRAYKRAFRRVYVIVHGGGKRAAIDARLARAGLPPLNADIGGLPKAPVAVLWSVLPAGSPTVPQNRPRHFYPGSRWVDWVGTDIYSDNQDWKALKGLYRRFSGKPFALPEWGVVGANDPTFVRRLLGWVDRHRRCKMLVYYQDFGSSSPYRLQNHPASLRVLRRWLHHPRIPHFAPNAPRKPPPPKGGVGARRR